VSFDGSLYANDERRQFLNGAFINNPTIPFVYTGLGAIAYWNPVEPWYISAGGIDAQGDFRETGFRTAFGGEDYFIYMVETGVVSEFEGCNGKLPGAYRLGMWYDPQPRRVSRGEESEEAEAYRDTAGVYVTCDQMIARESGEAGCDQGFGVFGRYGYAPARASDLTQFWSVGGQYKGLFDGRDEDVLGFAFGQGVFSDAAEGVFTADYESAIEVYYNIQATPWANVTPSVQYIMNPSGDAETDNATVVGLRAQIVF
jgi:porin